MYPKSRMSWQSVNDILDKLEIQAQIRAQPFQRVLCVWNDVVGLPAAVHSRPISMQRQVLRVATSSAAFAQNLMFQRQKILQGLNSHLDQPLIDLRCSTAGWHLPLTPTQELKPSLQEHPSYIYNTNHLTEQTSSPSHIGAGLTSQELTSRENVNIAFASWAQKIKIRSHNLPLCPQCQAPTPPGELQRWGVCSLCVAKQFTNNLGNHRE